MTKSAGGVAWPGDNRNLNKSSSILLDDETHWLLLARTGNIDKAARQQSVLTQLRLVSSEDHFRFTWSHPRIIPFTPAIDKNSSSSYSIIQMVTLTPRFVLYCPPSHLTLVHLNLFRQVYKTSFEINIFSWFYLKIWVYFFFKFRELPLWS